MLRALLILALAATLAGCASAVVTAPVTLRIADTGDPNLVLLRLHNDAQGAIRVSASGFQLVDAKGLVAGRDVAATRAMGDAAFPEARELAGQEEVQGWVSFGALQGAEPYAIAYSFAGVAARVELRPAP
ncbi:MAG TPA: hypothetical protein VM370_03695 [Candidatus Thermoplasmatota archaeon]|nr:hypothetical protein [Candidatus Thermoplasmatota archaeon]